MNNENIHQQDLVKNDLRPHLMSRMRLFCGVCKSHKVKTLHSQKGCQTGCINEVSVYL